MEPNLATLPARHEKAIQRMREQVFRKFTMADYGFETQEVLSWHFGHIWETLGGLSFQLTNSKGLRLEYRITHSEGDSFDLTLIDRTVGHTKGIRAVKFADLDARLLAFVREFHDYQNATPRNLYGAAKPLPK